MGGVWRSCHWVDFYTHHRELWRESTTESILAHEYRRKKYLELHGTSRQMSVFAQGRQETNRGFKFQTWNCTPPKAFWPDLTPAPSTIGPDPKLVIMMSF